MGTVTFNPTQVFTGATAYAGALATPAVGVPATDIYQQQLLFGALGNITGVASSLSQFAADASVIDDAMNVAKPFSSIAATVVDQNGLGLATLVGDPSNDRKFQMIGSGPVNAGTRTPAQLVDLALAGNADAKAELHRLLAGPDGYWIFTQNILFDDKVVAASLIRDLNFFGIHRGWSVDVSRNDYLDYTVILETAYSRHHNVSALDELVELAHLSKKIFWTLVNVAKKDELAKQRLYEMVGIKYNRGKLDVRDHQRDNASYVELALKSNTQVIEAFWVKIRSDREAAINFAVEALRENAAKGGSHAVRLLIDRMQSTADPYEKKRILAILLGGLGMSFANDLEHYGYDPKKLACLRMIAAVDKDAARWYKDVTIKLFGN